MPRAHKMAARSPYRRGAHHMWSSTTQDEKDNEKRNDDGEGAVMLPLASSLDSISEEAAAGHNDANPGDGKIRTTDFSSLKVPFPWRLWQLLEDSEKNGNQSIVSWLLGGDGFSISKPSVFTDNIMKAYFALTTYDSFIQELLKYGFMLTIDVNDRLKRVDVFRHPRYNRKDKLRSLAIRRRSAVKSFSARLSAKFLKEHPYASTGVAAPPPRPPPLSDQEEKDSQSRPAAFMFLSCTSRPASTHVVTGEVKNHEEEESLKNHVASILDPYYEARNRLNNKEVGDPVLRCKYITGIPYWHSCFMDGGDLEGGQLRGTIVDSGSRSRLSTSSTRKIDQSVDADISSSWWPLMGLDDAHPLASTCCPEKERHGAPVSNTMPAIDYHEGWIALPENDNHDEVQGSALEFGSNLCDALCARATVGTANTTLTELLQVSSSHVPAAVCSEFSKLFFDVQHQPELENILDGDTMESIFD